MKKLGKNRPLRDRFILSAAILTRWRQPVASGVALVPLHRAMRLVLYRRTATASVTAGKYGALFVVFFLNANPVVRRGNTVRILAQWRHPVASGVAMNSLHWAMRAVSYRRISLAVELGPTEVHSIAIDDFAVNLIVAY